MGNPFLDPPGRAYDWAESNPIGTSTTQVLRSADGQPFDPLVDVGYGKMLQSQVDRAKANADVVGGAVGSLGGWNSALANKKALHRAVEMAQRSELPRTILQKTGWWKNPQGEWKFEIPDENMLLRVTDDPKGRGFLVDSTLSEVNTADISGHKLPDVIDHEVLFKHYPSFRDIKVGDDVSSGGAANWDYRNHQINLAPGWTPINQIRRLLGHEIGHATQSYERWSNGSAPIAHLPKNFKDMVEESRESVKKFIKMTEKENIPIWQRDALLAVARNAASGNLRPQDPYFMQFSKFLGDFPELGRQLYEAGRHSNAVDRVNSEAKQIYKTVTGEADARVIERRLDYSPRQREVKPFWEDYDVSPRNQIGGSVLPWNGDRP